MDQNEAIRVVSQALIKDSAVRAVFLKGSHARGEEDAFSDVDMYCLLNCDLMEGFLERRISYLENYRKLIYWSESDFVGPQIVGFFEDGLHFDLYTVTNIKRKCSR
jgi:predicted nucleotidyltransferase